VARAGEPTACRRSLRRCCAHQVSITGTERAQGGVNRALQHTCAAWLTHLSLAFVCRRRSSGGAGAAMKQSHHAGKVGTAFPPESPALVHALWAARSPPVCLVCCGVWQIVAALVQWLRQAAGIQRPTHTLHRMSIRSHRAATSAGEHRSSSPARRKRITVDGLSPHPLPPPRPTSQRPQQ
jgi:hypothetical protein